MKACILAENMLVRFLYSFLIAVSWHVLRIIALFQPKMKLFVAGRKQTFPQLRSKIVPNTKYIWMHVASLGEYEQGLPVLEKLRSDYPTHKIVLTFFSPSGYEVKKDTSSADVIVYLPMDTLSNSKKFLELVKPELAIFVKYEIWPNYLYGLKRGNIPVVLVSAIFSKRQVFFKWYGGFMRKSLGTITHFFVQNKTSRQLLNSLGHTNISVSGDTRFDRVAKITEQDNYLDFMQSFKGGYFCFVAGSSWPEDEKILVDCINSSTLPIKYVIAPHNIKRPHIQELKKNISKKSVCYSEIGKSKLSHFEVLIVDAIGLLTKIYSYADVAYVGGGFATGLHNTLEPATFGIPVIIGPQYGGFKEAEDLVAKKGICVISNGLEFKKLMGRFVTDVNFRKETGNINDNYIKENVGSAREIMDWVKDHL